MIKHIQRILLVAIALVVVCLAVIVASIGAPNGSVRNADRSTVDGPMPLQGSLAAGKEERTTASLEATTVTTSELVDPPRQVVIRGVVVDESGAPMSGVRVEFRSPIEAVVTGKDRGFRAAPVGEDGRFEVALPSVVYGESAHYAIMAAPVDGQPIFHGVGYVGLAPDIVLTGRSRRGEGWDLRGSLRLRSPERHSGLLVLTTAGARKNLGIMQFNGNDVDVKITSPFDSLDRVVEPVVLMVIDGGTRFCLHAREFASLQECAQVLNAGYDVAIHRYSLMPSFPAAATDAAWIKVKSAATTMGASLEGRVKDGVFQLLSSAQSVLVVASGGSEGRSWVSAVELPSYEALLPLTWGAQLPGPCSLNAKVMAADGMPAAGARVDMRLVGEAEGRSLVVHEESGDADDKGVLVMSGLPEGRYLVSVAAPGFRTRSFSWDLPSGPMLVEVSKAASVAFDISANGQAWDSSDMRLYVRSEGEKTWKLKILPTIGNNLCVVGDMPVGRVDLVLLAGKCYAFSTCDLAAGLMHRVPMLMGVARRVYGVVRLPDSTPAARLRFKARLFAGNYSFPEIAFESDERGAFAVTVPGQGDLRVESGDVGRIVEFVPSNDVDRIDMMVRSKS